MQVKFYATFRQVAGTKMIDVDVQADSSIRDILFEVTQQFPILEKYFWKEPGVLAESVQVFINGEKISRLNGLETTVKSEDHVDIFPPVVGG